MNKWQEAFDNIILAIHDIPIVGPFWAMGVLMAAGCIAVLMPVMLVLWVIGILR